MKENLSMGYNTTTININSSLYDQLRKFCDKEGQWVKDFIEDALENAIYTEESIKVLNEEIKSLKKKKPGMITLSGAASRKVSTYHFAHCTVRSC